ncbi:MAG: hypothetical protein WB566_00630 [Terriglobales bacterium]
MISRVARLETSPQKFIDIKQAGVASPIVALTRRGQVGPTCGRLANLSYY